MMERSCFAIAVLLAVTLYGVKGDSDWMPGIPGTCYKFVQHGTSSQGAAVECAVMGGHLAWLQTSEEQTKFEEVRRKFGYLNQSFWIGGVKDSYGRWFWANYLEPNCMAPVTETDWHSGPPSGDCLVFETNGNTLGWGAANCGTYVYFVCEKFCQ